MKHIPGVNNHHIAWCKNDYKTSTEKLFRQHKALVVPMYIEAHDELHFQLDPPPKLTKNHMLGAVALLNGLDYEHNQLGAIDILAWQFATSGDDLGARFGKHMFKQLDLIKEGIYDGPRTA